MSSAGYVQNVLGDYGRPSLPTKSNWRPIHTAPKDGTLVLLYNTAHDDQAVMGWTPDVGMPDIFPDGCWTDAGARNRAINLTVNSGYFQFWQPLPAPPTA